MGHSVAALTAALGAPLAGVALALRPSWRRGLGERLGSRPPGPGGAVWVHAASVGEARAALRVLDLLDEGGVARVASTATWTGRALLREARPGLATALAPLDHPWCVARALGRVAPSVIAFVETELWPSWLRGAVEAGVPPLVVSGRISDRSLPRYRRLAPLLRPSFARLAAVGARSDRDAARFASLGVPEARITVTGDLKLEPPAPRALPPELVAVLGATPLVVAGSTHEGEEEAALAALARVEAEGASAALVLAPRHHDRFERVARLVAASGRTLRRRSRPGALPLAPGEVLLLDSLGELPALWPRAAVAFVGGSLAPVGGHNVLEPVFHGRPVLFGPHTGSARDAVALVLESGAGERVADAAELGARVAAALADPAAWARRGARGAEALALHRGAAARSVELILRVRSEARPRGAPP